MSNDRRPSQSTLRVGLLLVAAFLFGMAFEQGTFHQWFGAISNHEKAVRKYDQALRYIDEYHVDDHDPEVLTRRALKAISEHELDRHSSYLDPETWDTFSRSTKGEYVGLGIRVSKHEETGYIEIIHPFRGSPAMKHDIKPGDQIVAVEGSSTKNMSLQESVANIKGPEGTEVTITVRSKDKAEQRQITLKRAMVDIPTVAKWGMFSESDPPIGYITVRQFSGNTVEAFKNALKRLMDQNIHGLIIDLRMNPGGLLGASVDLADLFLKPGKKIVTVRQRGEENVHRSSSEPLWTDGPVTILLNEHSASASEVFSAALRDHGVASLVGTRSFGKGSVQQPFTLPGEEDALKVTVARYYTPSGKTFDRKATQEENGSEPDKSSETDSPEQSSGGKDDEKQYGLTPDYPVPIADTDEERQAELEKLLDSWQEAASTSADDQMSLDIYRDKQLKKALEVVRSNQSDDD